MIAVDVTLAGADQLVRTLGDAGDRLGDLAGVNQAAGDLVIGAARIPRRTGRLADGTHAVGTTAGVDLVAEAPYAAAVHARNPFLTDALTAREGDVVDLYLGHVDDVLDHIEGA